MIGGFCGIGWFATFVYKNEKQIGHLHSLRRAIALHVMLEDPGDPA